MNMTLLHKMKSYKWWGSIPTYYIYEISKFLRDIDGNHTITLASEAGRVIVSSDNPIALEEYVGQQYWRDAVRGLSV